MIDACERLNDALRTPRLTPDAALLVARSLLRVA